MGVMEVQNATSTVDTTATQYVASTPSSLSIATTNAIDYIFAAVPGYHNVDVFTFGSPFTLDSQSNGSDASTIRHLGVGAAGTYTLTVTITAPAPSISRRFWWRSKPPGRPDRKATFTSTQPARPTWGTSTTPGIGRFSAKWQQAGVLSFFPPLAAPQGGIVR